MIANANSGTLKRLLRMSSVTVAALLTYASPGYAAELIWTGDFETGDFSQYKDHLYGLDDRSTKNLVTSPVRSGRYATELTILGLGVETGTERAELMTQLGSGGRIHFDWDGPQYWIGFSFLFKEWDANAHTFFQVHAPNEPKGDPCDFAGNTFSIWGDGEKTNADGLADKVAVRVIEEGGISDGKGAASNNRVIHNYPFPIDEWQDYVVNFKLSTRGDGFYKIWKNGELIYSKSGLTNVNYRDSCGNLIPEEQTHHNGVHIGVYANGDAYYRRIFYDEVRVARGPDGFELVAPTGTGQSTDETVATVPNPPVVHDN